MFGFTKRKTRGNDASTHPEHEPLDDGNTDNQTENADNKKTTKESAKPANENENDDFIEKEDLSKYFLGKCCPRPACFFATKETVMHYCPYCAGELKEVYDFFSLFDFDIKMPFSHAQLKKTYKLKSLQFHPDKGDELDGADDFLLLSEGYKIIKDGALREKYWVMVNKCKSVLFPKVESVEDVPNEGNPTKNQVYFSLNVFFSIFLLVISFGLSFYLWGANMAWLFTSIVIALVFAFFHFLHRIMAFFIVLIGIGGFIASLVSQMWLLTTFIFILLLVVFYGFNWFDNLLTNKFSLKEKNDEADAKNSHGSDSQADSSDSSSEKDRAYSAGG